MDKHLILASVAYTVKLENDDTAFHEIKVLKL